MYDLYMPQVFFSGHSKRLVCMTCIYPKYFQWSRQEAGIYDLCAPSNFSSHSKRLVGRYDLYIPQVFFSEEAGMYDLYIPQVIFQ